MPSYLGIDPGVSGGMALVSDASVLRADDIPTHAIDGKNRLDLAAICRWVRTTGATGAVIERVSAMPGQGVTGMFRFGEAFGALQMAIVAAAIPITYVAPGVWKRAYGLTADKDSARQRASEMFPQHAALWARKKDHGRAEAVLLAHWLSKRAARAP